MRRRSLTCWLALAGALLAIGPAAAESGEPQPATFRQPVACKDLRTLRELRSQLSPVRNPRTGNTLYYAVVGDAARSDELLVLFNGTGGILPDWPVQMLTNSRYSPKIVRTLAYSAAEDGPISLCHDYRLVLSDNPGVGRSPLHGPVTADEVANDVDAMLGDIGARYRIPTNRVNPVGWSLGTLGYCPTAGAHFNSTGCRFAPSQTPEMSATNGGICVTESSPANLPVSRRCARLRIGGRITVLNGPEDLFIQWTYGRALVEGYQRAYGAEAAKLVTYRGSDGAGHGVLIQHPRWTQRNIYLALGNH